MVTNTEARSSRRVAYVAVAMALGVAALPLLWKSRTAWAALRYSKVTAAVDSGARAPIQTLYYKPRDWDPASGRLMVLLHGADRRPAAMLDSWRAFAETRRLLLIAPEFSERAYKGVLSYNLAGTIGADGTMTPARNWAFPAVDDAVDAVRQATGAVRRTYVLYGFSAGAQFALRSLLLTGAPRADLVVASSAGWYTLPTSAAWPCGMGNTGISAAAALSRPLAIQVGERDIATGDDFGDAGYEACAERQGRNRLSRALYFYKSAQESAAEQGVTLAWTLNRVPHAAHSREAQAEDAVRWLAQN